MSACRPKTRVAPKSCVEYRQHGTSEVGMQGSPPGDNTSIALHRRKGPGRGIETDDLAQLIADAGLVAARHGLAGKRERERESEREWW